MSEPRVGQRLKCPLPCLPSIRATALDARRSRFTSGPLDYRPICAQFENRLMSLRRLVSTLRAPSPAVRLGRLVPSGQGVQKRLPVSAAPPKKNTHRIPTRRKVHASDTTAVIRTFLIDAAETVSIAARASLSFLLRNRPLRNRTVLTF
jgi:hypothetical protein